jgi:hypothetical protein
MRYSKNPDEIGAKLGPKLVQLISHTVAATKLKLLDTEHRARVASMQTVIDQAGREIADLYRPVLSEVIREQDMPDEVRQLIERAISGTHQWHAIAGLVLSGGGATSALSTIISNFLAPGVRSVVSSDPQILPVPETLAQLGVKGAMDWGDVYNYAAGAGYASFTMDSLKEGYYAYPDFQTALELFRRGVISQDQAVLALTRAGIPPDWHNAILQLSTIPLSPADLADMVVRGIKNQDEAQTLAGLSGVIPADFEALVLDTGEPLGLQSMLEAFRRGFMDQARLEHGIRQSRIRDEWIDIALALRYSPMSVADAVNAVVQNHLTADEGSSIAQQNGLEPGAFGILTETAGEPLSRTELEQLYNRGLIDQATVEQGLRESRLKNKYIPDALQLHVKLPPVFTVQHALQYGAVSHERAVEVAVAEGYSHDDAEWIVSAGVQQRLDTFKNEVIHSTTTAYVDNLMSPQQVTDTVTGLGFTDEQAAFILQAAEVRRVNRAVTSAVSAIRGKYLAHHITANDASNLIDSMGVPATQRDFLLSLWIAESTAYTKTLTEAQVVKAVNKKLISQDDALARLTAMGYNDTDAQLLLDGA